MKRYNIYNKVRTLSLATAIAAMGAGTVTSCGDFLEIEPRNEITLEKFWNEKSDVQGIISGCYSKIAEEPILARMMVWGEFRSENVVINDEEADLNLKMLLTENLTASNAYTYWGDFYTVINRCNTVIKYAPGVAESDPSYSQSELKAHIAEVTALRSLMYFYLIRTFRDVPYTEEAFLDDNQAVDMEQMKFDEILSKLIKSLESVKDDALDVYPEATGSAAYFNTGRITKSAINAMLADMYLWQKDYEKCIERAQEVIDFKKKMMDEDKSYTSSDFADFDGYPIIGTRVRSSNNDFGRAFNSIFVTGNSIEGILEVNFIKKSGSSQPSNVPVSKFYGNDSRSPYVSYSTYVGRDEIDGLYKVYDKDNKGLDARGYENFWISKNAIYKYTSSSGLEISFPKGTDPTKINSYKAVSSMYPTEGGNKYESRNKSNWIIYRLTDVMLMQAEAYSQLIAQESGTLTEASDKVNLQKAFKLVNAVNKRSLMQYPLADTLKLSTYTSKTAITNLVYEERNRELMFEGKRYYDLVRRSERENSTEYMWKACGNKSTQLQSIIKSKLQKKEAMYWPINLEETKINKKLVQNPAFGSGENGNYTNTTK